MHVPPILIIPKVEEDRGDYCEAHGNITQSINENTHDTYDEDLLTPKGKFWYNY